MEVLHKRTIGVNFNETGGADILLWSPLAETVSVLLVDTNQTLPLHKHDYGYWLLSTNLISPGDLYQFVINGQPLPDPASLFQPNGVHGPSAAIDIRTFEWTDTNWMNIPLAEYIFYELHTGTFTAEGTFASIEEKLDYLKELGITAIEIMPVAQFSGHRNWGYDGVFPFAVQDSYGGAKSLQQLIDKCHQKGLAVVLDVVYNHLGPEGNYLGSYGPYFTDKYKTPWGSAVNFDDAGCDGVRQFFIQNALMWLRDFHIDALRLDAVHAIKDLSPVHILKEIKLHVDSLRKETGRNYYLIVESDLNDTKLIKPLNGCGYGMDAQWTDEFHHALRVTAGNERSGYYADFSGVAHLAKAYKDAYVYDGQYSAHRKRKFGIKADGHTGEQFVVFSQNHDQVGNRMIGERTCHLVSFEMQKLLAGAVLVSPYLPLLFMGEEWSEPNPFLYFVSHSDEELIEAVRQGRKKEFEAFYIEGEVPDPVDEISFQNSKLQWQLINHQPHKTMLQYYKALLSLRKTNVVLKHLDRENVEVTYDSNSNVIQLHRWHQNEHILAIMNFSKETQLHVLNNNTQQWHTIFNSASSEWQGPFEAPLQLNSSEEIMLQPESILIVSNKSKQQ